MNKYNKIWTRDKFVEYRKLKKQGYTDKMLIEHFGDDIKHSDLYHFKSYTIPMFDTINETIINNNVDIKLIKL